MPNLNTSLSSIAASCFQKLQDPYLVSAFQNFFGVVPAESPVKNGTNNDDFTISQETSLDCKNEGSEMNGFTVRKRTDSTHAKKKSVTPKYKIESKFWYYVFCFGTSLGYEVFYITFFPFWMWNLNGAVCRPVVYIWAIVMYIGQALKDLMRWPRPASPPVLQLEPKYVAEYGMPSTHALIGFVLPVSILYFTMDRYEYPFVLGVFIAFLWCLLVCCSRLYMGMHTVLDLIGGLLLAPIVLVFVLPLMDIIDTFQVTNVFSPLITTVVTMFFLLIYPKTPHYSPSWGDTATILGTNMGYSIGVWLNYQLGFMKWTKPKLLQIMWPNYQWIGLSILRLVLGLSCVLLSRLVVKTTVLKILCSQMKLDPNDIKTKQNPKVELPGKFSTFIGVGFGISFLGPALFRFLNIERLTAQYDV